MSEPQFSSSMMEDCQQNPILLKKLLWPDVEFYDKQIEIVESVRDNSETVVVAGNMLGKDFIAAFIALWYFMCFDFVRIVSTSVKDKHLMVLWDEISSFVRRSRIPLRAEEGGLLDIKHHEIRKIYGSPHAIEKSYLIGQVSLKGEGMSGHHAEHTMLIVDEASGVEDVVYEHACEWARKRLIFGNPNPCTNFFYRGVKQGDLLAEE